MIDVSIIIVTYKEDLRVLRECFSSLRTIEGVTVEPIVVDNAARIETRDLVDGLLPNAAYIENAANGFAKAVNLGMKASHGRYVLLLNPDTVLPKATLATMVEHMDRDQEVGIGSCVIRYPDGRLQESIRRFPTLCDQVAVMLKLPHVFPGVVNRYMMRDVDPEATQDVDSIMGAFMMIRRRVIEDIGMFDERYFMWFEEVDYCKMAKDAGYVIRNYGDTHVVHHKGHMFDQLGTVRKQRWVRESMRKYFAKHHGKMAWLILFALAPVFITLGYLAATVKRR